MKRRNFLQFILLGFLSNINVFASKKNNFKNIQNSWLNSLIKSVNAKKNSISLLAKQQVLAIQNTSKLFSNDYQLSKIFYKTDKQILVPIALENYPANLFDINLLCFDLSNEKLRLQTILSAYDLELIATQIIGNQNLPLSFIEDFRKYKESISMKVNVSSGKTSVQVSYKSISKENKTLKYISNHCLFNS